MDFGRLLQTFSNKSGRTALNYLWLNRSVFEENEEARFGVPAFVMERAFDNARAHPDADVNLWIDGRFLPSSKSSTIEEIQNLIKQSGLKNLHLKDLRDDEAVPASSAYRYTDHDALYAPGADGGENSASSIGWRVDTAKLFILRTCLTKGYKAAVFSDADIKDPLLNDENLAEILKEYGLAAGRPDPRAEIENQFIVFAKDGYGARNLGQTNVQIIDHILERNFRNPLQSGFEDFRHVMTRLVESEMWAKPAFLVLTDWDSQEVPQTEAFPDFIHNSQPLCGDSTNIKRIPPGYDEWSKPSHPPGDDPLPSQS